MLKNLTVKAKLGLLVSFMSVLFVAIGAVGLWGMNESVQGLRTVYQDRVRPLEQLKSISDNYAVKVIDPVNKANAGRLRAGEALRGVEQAQREIAETWEAYMATTLTDKEQRLAEQAQTLFRDANRDVERLVDALAGKSGMVEGELDRFDGPLYESIDPITSQIGELINLQLRVANQEYQAAEAAYAGVRAFTIGAIIVGLALAVAIGVWLVRSITGPLNRAVDLADRMSKGDLTQSVTVTSHDEVGRLLQSMQNMVRKLSSVVGDVNSSSNALASASEEVSATAQNLSQGASEQASNVEETTSSVEQMSASIQQNTENAKVTDSTASEAAGQAREGGEAVDKTVEAMKSIAEKISIIDDIAYQTNLLALNAAIEAARAGEHGKGFAVVAAEVRKLAERSQVASQEIGEVAQNSVSLAEQAGELLEQMVPAIQKTSDLVQEISAASKEQSTGATQINQAMEQLNSITQQSASSSEELASTSEEMSSQAQQLQQLMAFFKVSEEGGGQRGGGSGGAPRAAAGGRSAPAAAVSTAAAADDDDDEYKRF